MVIYLIYLLPIYIFRDCLANILPNKVIAPPSVSCKDSLNSRIKIIYIL